MRIVVQRVREASVTADGETLGAIGRGLVVLVGFTAGDDRKQAHWMAEKVAHLRIFNDPAGRMNRSVLDVSGEVLVVSQFTLYGDATKGRRPSFIRAAPPEAATPLYEYFLAELRGLLPAAVQSGRSGAVMEVALVNDGPVTLLIER